MFESQDIYLKLLNSLPLNEAPLERCRVTGNIGRHAPHGKAFRMTGQFWTHEYMPNPYYEMRPEQSIDSLIAEKQKNYDYPLLEEFGSDKEAVVDALREDRRNYIEEDEEFPNDFIGKWLTVSVADPLVVRVLTEPFVTFKPQTGVLNGITKDPIFVFDTGETEISWQQYYSEAEDGKAEVTLVDYKEPDNSLYIPEPRNNTEIEKLYLGGPPTFAQWIKYYENVWGAFPEDKRWYWIRKYRKEGIPFADDPLRDFEFSLGNVARLKKRTIIKPEKPKHRWIIRPGQEDLADHLDKVERGEIEF
jgi:hypothetical protein